MSIDVKNLPNLSVFPHFTYEKYEGKAAHQGNTCYVLTGRIQLTVSERLVYAIKALALTILTLGVGLLLSQVQEFWKSALYGTKQVKAYGTIDQMPDSIKSAVLNAENVADLKPLKLEGKLTKEKALELILEGTIELEQLPSHLREDPIFLIDVVKNCDFDVSYTAKYAYYRQILSLPDSHSLFNNEDFLLDLIERFPLFIRKVPANLINDKNFLLKAFDTNPKITRIIPLPDSHTADEDLIIKWISVTSGTSGRESSWCRFDTFNRMSENLKKDEQFCNELKLADGVETFLKCQASNFNDEDLTLSLIKKDPTVFLLLPETKKSDPSFFVKAIKANVYVFDYIATNLKHNEIFVLGLIKYELIDVKDKNTSERNLRKFISLLILDKNPLYVDFVFIEKMTKQISSLSLGMIPEHMLNNRNFLLKILDESPLGINDYQYLPKKFANDKEVILKWISVKLKPEDMDNISSDLKKDPQFVEQAKERNPNFEKLLKEESIRHVNEDRALELIKEDSTNIFKMHPRLQKNQPFLIKCMKENWKFHLLIPKLRAFKSGRKIDAAFILEIVEHTGKIPEWTKRGFYSERSWKKEKNLIKLITLIKDPKVFIQLIDFAWIMPEFSDLFKSEQHLFSLSDAVANDRDVIIRLIKEFGSKVLPLASDALRNDPAIVVLKSL